MKINLKSLSLLFIALVCCTFSILPTKAFADTCRSYVLNVSINDNNGQIMTTMSWFTSHNTQHYICNYADSSCKIKYSMLLTAMALGKPVDYSYTGRTCGDGTNLTAVHPDSIVIVTE